MNAATQSAAARHASAGTTATRNPNLSEKDESVISIRPHLSALWRQRRATRDRIAALEVSDRRTRVEIDALHAQVTADSLLMGTSSVQQPGVISAETRQSDEEILLALAERLWTPVELAVFAALNAEGGRS